MSRSIEAAPGLLAALRPKLDGAAPLLKAVVREVAVEAGKQLTRQSDVPHTAHLLLKGFVCHHRLLANGRRQTTAIMVPGDVCDLGAVMRGRADYFVETLTASTIGEISADQIHKLNRTDPEVSRALLQQLLRDEAILREWMVGMGRRSAKVRFAHLLSELRERLRRVGLGDDDIYDLALTQAAFADVLGLSTVHVNRVLQWLRADALIEIRGRAFHIIDHAALAKLAGFDPTYLESA